MEIWDIYDVNREKTGCTAFRGRCASGKMGKQMGNIYYDF